MDEAAQIEQAIALSLADAGGAAAGTEDVRIEIAEAEAAAPLARQSSHDARRQARLRMPAGEDTVALLEALNALSSQCSTREYHTALAYISGLVRRWSADGQGFVIDRHESQFKYKLGRFSAASSVMLALGMALTTKDAQYFEMLQQPRDGWREEALFILSSGPGEGEGGAEPGGAAERASMLGAGGAEPEPAAAAATAAAARAEPEQPSLTRQLSGVMDGLSDLARLASQGGAREQFECSICLCPSLVEESITLPCRHRFCRDCVAGYCESKINDGQLIIKCPDLAPAQNTAAGGGEEDAPDVGCPELLKEDLVLELISPAAAEKYQRFDKMKKNQNLRDCPGAPDSGGCGALVEPRKGWVWGFYPEMTCQKCNHSFCLVHSNAHLGQSCRQYEVAQREQAKKDKAALAEITKPCPKCGAATEKNHGCNHMTCTNTVSGERCGCDWCWICGKAISGGACKRTVCLSNLRQAIWLTKEELVHQTPRTTPRGTSSAARACKWTRATRTGAAAPSAASTCGSAFGGCSVSCRRCLRSPVPS